MASNELVLSCDDLNRLVLRFRGGGGCSLTREQLHLGCWESIRMGVVIGKSEMGPLISALVAAAETGPTPPAPAAGVPHTAIKFCVHGSNVVTFCEQCNPEASAPEAAGVLGTETITVAELLGAIGEKNGSGVEHDGTFTRVVDGKVVRTPAVPGTATGEGA